MRLSVLLLMFIFLTSWVQTTKAQVKPAGIFGDHMVLQRDKPIKIWGRASQGERISVSLGPNTTATKASKSGEWMVLLPAMSHGGPYTLRIQGTNEVVFNDVLIGEVWLCSGQSNMEWSVANVDSAKREIEKSNHALIRHIKIPRNPSLEPVSDISAADWKVCSPETVGGFTAVGYFFAREIQQRLGIPIGLINASWGGTHVETWTSAASFYGHPEFAYLKDKLPASIAQLKADTSKTAKAKLQGDGLHPNAYASLLYNGMIHPIVGIGMRGALWYQGESNAARAEQYNISFPLMIKDWRTRWKEEFPFYFVQLTNFQANKGNSQNGGSNWAELREAQANTLRLTNTGMAVITDIGNTTDIHPRNKQDVGKRLALQAFKKTYAIDTAFEGPSFQYMDIIRNKAYITCKNTFGGFEIRNKYGYINGFELAGADKEFHYAKAVEENGRIVVTCDKVPVPVAVRYGWSDDVSDLNLFNKAGLPLAPFRTDDWPRKTKEVKFTQ